MDTGVSADTQKEMGNKLAEKMKSGKLKIPGVEIDDTKEVTTLGKAAVPVGGKIATSDDRIKFVKESDMASERILAESSLKLEIYLLFIVLNKPKEGEKFDASAVKKISFNLKVADASGKTVYSLDKEIAAVPASKLADFESNKQLYDLAGQKLYVAFSHYIREDYLAKFSDANDWSMKLSRFNVNFKSPIEVFEIEAEEEECGYDLSSFEQKETDQIWLKYQRSLQNLCKFRKIAVELNEKFKTNMVNKFNEDVTENLFSTK